MVKTEKLFPASSQHKTLVGATVIKIGRDSVTLDSEVELDGKSTSTIPFSHLVIATGSVGHFPIRIPEYKGPEDAKKAFRKLQDEVKGAKKLLIIGGGPVGFEFAGEVTEYYDGSKGREKKEITLVNANPKLLHADIKDGIHRKALTTLEKTGVNVIMGHYVNGVDATRNGALAQTQTFTLDDGRTVEADFVLIGVGSKANSSIIVESFGEDAVEPNTQQVKVRTTLQLPSQDNIFAIGDCNNVKENKQAAFIIKQATTATDNIVALINNTSLKDYSPQTTLVMLASYGTKDATGQLPFGFSAPSWLGSRLKSKGLFADKFAAAFNTTTFA
ncbi:Apoptosis-inducing factor 2, variant 2 [Umbelopsis sp. WA50703]|jgi:NADH dehydrogenase FAD-containing subunit